MVAITRTSSDIVSALLLRSLWAFELSYFGQNAVLWQVQEVQSGGNCGHRVCKDRRVRLLMGWMMDGAERSAGEHDPNPNPIYKCGKVTGPLRGFGPMAVILGVLGSSTEKK